MELKSFQKDALGDLKRFLELLTEHENIRKAYKELWEERGVPIVSEGMKGMQAYEMSLQGVPQVCLKVPTGGGKTYIAANAVRLVFDAMTHVHPKCVVWLVPSDAILQQTYKALSDNEHPYRRQLDTDFGGKVEVYTKDQLLAGKNFGPMQVDENLSVFVLSYDSFRTNKKEGRKAYQENGNLLAFPDFFGDKQELLPDTAETALIQVIRNLNPLAIVDESHHATSKLSVEMLENFNPCFVLELTATPKKGSNIISVVDARKLKKEEMVKLPVIVYNQKNQEDVYLSAIGLRNRLEKAAVKEEEKGGKYIRPIVLFQAQPRMREDSSTYEVIKRSLIQAGVPEEYIAIKTGEKDEIKDIDLLSRNCPIRYIITVNALKEGWDCPFAYILATVANRSSVVDVEQILGRILRMPYAKAGKFDKLNISYAITSSADFYTTLEKVVAGLVNAGFSRRDHRIAGDEFSIEEQPAEREPEQTQENISAVFEEQGSGVTGGDGAQEEPNVPVVDVEDLKRRLEALAQTGDDILEQTGNDSRSSEDATMIEEMLGKADDENRIYWESINDSDEGEPDVPYEVAEKMNSYTIKPEFQDEAEEIIIPQFMRDDGIAYLNESGHQLLNRDDLREGFTLKDKDTIIDFGSIQAELAKVDLDKDSEALPKAFRLHGYENEAMKEWFDSRPTESKRSRCRDIIVKRVSKIEAIGDADIKAYVSRVMDGMTEEQLSDLEQSPELYAKKIREKVEKLLEQYEAEQFKKMLEQDMIVCEPSFHLKERISPSKSISSI